MRNSSNEIKLGIHITSSQLYPLDAALKSAIHAERSGFDAIWVADHTVSVPRGGEWLPTMEGWTTLTAIAMKTRNALLGVSVTDPHRRHPATLAQTATTLDTLSGGRVLLGIGPGEAMNLDAFGIPRDKPVPKMRECIEVMKRLWTGKPVDYEGRFWKLKGARLVPTPLQHPMPVWVGAWSPLSLKATAELGDGWIPSRYTPELYRKDLALITEHSRKAGRSQDAVEPGCIIQTFIDEDYDVALRFVQNVSMRMNLAISPRQLLRSGFKPPREFDIVNWDPASGSMEALREKAAELPHEVVEKFVPYGTPDDCLKKYEEFVEAGVRHLVFIFMGSPKQREKSQRLFSQKILPHLKDRG